MEKYGVKQGSAKTAARGCPMPRCKGSVTLQDGFLKCSVHGTEPWEANDTGETCATQETREK